MEKTRDFLRTFTLCLIVFCLVSGCGGGGVGSASNPVSPDKDSSVDSGGISGKVTPENGSELPKL